MTGQFRLSSIAGQVLGGILFLLPLSLYAQTPVGPPAAPLADVFSTGLRAFEGRHFEEAEAHFAAVIETDPAFFDADRGSAAYWRGRALQATGRPDAARARGALPPTSPTAHTLLAHARAEDHRSVRLRDAKTPRLHTNVLDAFEALSVAVRWARFLDDDGATRTEIFWTLPARTLHPSTTQRRRLTQAGKGSHA